MARNRRVRPWRMLASTSLPLSLTDAAPATGTAAADVTVAVTVRTGEVEEPPDEEPAPTRPHDHPRARGHVHASVPAQGGGAVEPAAIVEPQPAARPAGRARVPDGRRPDLRVLPACGIAVLDRCWTPTSRARQAGSWPQRHRLERRPGPAGGRRVPASRHQPDGRLPVLPRP